MRKIVCLSTSPWYPIPTRKQQVMSRIPDAEILYFDPAVSLLAPLRDREAGKKLWAYRKPGAHPQSNITVYSLPPVLPFFNKFHWINRLNQRRISRFVKKKLAQHEMDKPVLWTYSPTSCDCVDRIPHSALVYDCVDRHSAYGGLMDPKVVDAMEEALAAKADRVFATAQGLCDRLKAVNPNTVFLPNGANYARFSQAAQPQPAPADFPKGEGPVFGFVGALQECIAYDYVEYAAKKKPEWRFVFIGGEKPGADLSGLKALNNVFFLGLKPNDQLPAYMAQFDACLNLFASGDLSKDVSPLKFYEYLATGKPIVTTPQPDQVLAYRELIHVAHTKEEFVVMCAEAQADELPERKAARMEAGRESSWDARVAEMSRILETAGVFAPAEENG